MNTNVSNLAGDASLWALELLFGILCCLLNTRRLLCLLFPFEPGKPADFQLIDQSGML